MHRTEDAHADILLLERIVARDERAIADLYDRHNRLLFGLVLRILRDRSEAEDVLQEVFVLVWTRAETYNVALGPPTAWLVRVSAIFNTPPDIPKPVAMAVTLEPEGGVPSPTGDKYLVGVAN